MNGTAAASSSSQGIALVITLLAIGALSALGASLVLTSSVDRLTATNHADAVQAVYAADAALEIAASELASIANWNDVLTGVTLSRYSGGPVSGTRPLPGGGSVDLATLTNQLTCGSATTCSDARVRAVTNERPWGDNNPRWQPFLFAPLGSIGNPARLPASVYVIVWVGDDPAEVDGNPQLDGGGANGEGRFTVRAWAEAFGPGNTRRSIEAEISRICHVQDGAEVCLPGTRVHLWRLRAGPLP